MKTIKTGDLVSKIPQTLTDAAQFSETTSFPMQHMMSSRPTLGACLARAKAF